MNAQQVHDLTNRLRAKDWQNLEFKIRESAETIVKGEWSPLRTRVGNRVLIPWTARNPTYTLVNALPAPGESNYRTLEIIRPPTADDRAAMIVVEAQIREQLA